MANQHNFTEQQQAQQPQAAAGEAQDVTAAAQSTEQQPLAQMSELDRFGLAGLLRMIHSDSPDVASLAVGQDLMTLGLDLNQPDMPRDIMQELAAEELMGRKWRYHKIERCWLTRDETYPGPVDVEPRVSERGVYLIWDPTTWKKIRVCILGPILNPSWNANTWYQQREFILRYEDLDNRLDHNRGLARPLGFPHQAS
ncbi:hypothetical protein BA78_8494 [Aspergillus fumigatus]|nr:hypothetical protein BA78_8494 [Aspergillus fumigatus]